MTPTLTGNSITTALSKRYAVKVFDAEQRVSDTDLHEILESARLAPSTIGLEPWKFIVIENPLIRAQLRGAGYDQSKVTDASHLIVIARRTDSEHLVDELLVRTGATQGKTEEELAGLRQMAEGGITAKAEGAVRDGWLAAQTYIPLGMMIQTATLLGVDTGPMEGFDNAQVDEILGLKEKNLASVTMLALGYRGEDPYALLPKTRRSFNEVVETIT